MGSIQNSAAFQLIFRTGAT